VAGAPTVIARWWFPHLPVGRAATLRLAVYGFVVLDVLWWDRWLPARAAVPGDWYRPLAIGRLLHLPVPTSGFVHAVELTLLVAAVLALTGRAPRLVGAAVFLLYGEWMVLAMSYGKVDHDRFALLVALAVLPTVGRARLFDPRPSEAAGWGSAAYGWRSWRRTSSRRSPRSGSGAGAGSTARRWSGRSPVAAPSSPTPCCVPPGCCT
jgi:hypothetical protein